MKDKFGIFYKHLLSFKRTPNKFQNIKHFWVVLMSFKNEGHIWNFLQAFCVILPNKFHNIKRFCLDFWHFKDLVNEGQILNFHKHFI